MICKLEIYNGELNLFPVVTNERVFAQITMGNIVKGQPGVTPHIDHTTKHWFIGDEDTGVLAEGINGEPGPSGKSPYIGENGNWFTYGEDGQPVDTGKLASQTLLLYLNSDQTTTWEDFIEGFNNKKYIVCVLENKYWYPITNVTKLDTYMYRLMFKGYSSGSELNYICNIKPSSSDNVIIEGNLTYTTYLTKGSLVNNLNEVSTGSPLDATQGKVLKEMIDNAGGSDLEVIKLSWIFNGSPSVLIEQLYISNEENSKLFKAIDDKKPFIFVVYNGDFTDPYSGDMLWVWGKFDMEVKSTRSNSEVNTFEITTLDLYYYSGQKLRYSKMYVGLFKRNMAGSVRYLLDQNYHSIDFITNGDGTKFLSDDGKYVEVKNEKLTYQLPGYILGWWDTYRGEGATKSRPTTIAEIEELLGSYSEFLEAAKKNYLFMSRTKNYNSLTTSYMPVYVESWNVKDGQTDPPYFRLTFLCRDANIENLQKISIMVYTKDGNWNYSNVEFTSRYSILDSSSLATYAGDNSNDKVLPCNLSSKLFDQYNLIMGIKVTLKTGNLVEYPASVNNFLSAGLKLYNDVFMVLKEVGLYQYGTFYPKPSKVFLDVKTGYQLFSCTYGDKYTMYFRYENPGSGYVLTVVEQVETITEP